MLVKLHFLNHKKYKTVAASIVGFSVFMLVEFSKKFFIYIGYFYSYLKSWMHYHQINPFNRWIPFFLPFLYFLPPYISLIHFISLLELELFKFIVYLA